MRPLDKYIRQQLNSHLKRIEGKFKADAISIIGPIVYGMELQVRDALELVGNKKSTLVVIHAHLAVLLKL